MVTQLVAYKPKKLSVSLVLLTMKLSALWIKHPSLVYL